MKELQLIFATIQTSTIFFFLDILFWKVEEDFPKNRQEGA